MPTTNVTWLPAFNPDIYHPAFDETAALAANVVSGEVHTITATPTARGQQFIVPIFGPFYKKDFGIIEVATSRLLVEGVDYYFGFEYYAATHALASPVYGGIGFINNQLSGQYRIAYRTLGGEWCISRTKINEILSNLTLNPRIVYWDLVTNYPNRFPPIVHEYDLADMVGLKEEVDAIVDVAAAIRARPAPVITPTPVDPNKATVGLGLVDNFATATPLEASAGQADNLFVTPQGVKKAIDDAKGDTPMVISDDDQNRAMLGSDDGVYVPELQVRPSQTITQIVEPNKAYVEPTDDETTEAKLIEFATTTGDYILELFTNQGLLQNLETQNRDNLVAAINEILRESKLKTIAYDNRGVLRSMLPIADGAVIVDGIGLFSHKVGSVEPDDDETCFTTSSGAWELTAISWDYFNAVTLVEKDAMDQRIAKAEMFRSRFLQGQGIASITSVLAGQSASFLVPVKGAKARAVAFAQSTGIHNPKINATAKVILDGVVEVTLHNPSASIASLADGEVWQVFVINQTQSKA